MRNQGWGYIGVQGWVRLEFESKVHEGDVEVSWTRPQCKPPKYDVTCITKVKSYVFQRMGTKSIYRYLTFKQYLLYVATHPNLCNLTLYNINPCLIS